jgi:hypothetical protein
MASPGCSKMQPGDTVTGTVVGKKTLAPMTGHTNDYFTFEEWYPDISQSEQFVDCKQNMMTCGFACEWQRQGDI